MYAFCNNFKGKESSFVAGAYQEEHLMLTQINDVQYQQGIQEVFVQRGAVECQLLRQQSDNQY